MSREAQRAGKREHDKERFPSIQKNPIEAKQSQAPNVKSQDVTPLNADHHLSDHLPEMVPVRIIVKEIFSFVGWRGHVKPRARLEYS